VDYDHGVKLSWISDFVEEAVEADVEPARAAPSEALKVAHEDSSVLLE